MSERYEYVTMFIPDVKAEDVTQESLDAFLEDLSETLNTHPADRVEQHETIYTTLGDLRILRLTYFKKDKKKGKKK